MSGHSGSVLIVGAGVGGLAASTLLAQHGVSSLLVEKRREIFVYPKARNLTFRSLEILRRLGVGTAVDAAADHISNMVSKQSLSSADETSVFDAAFFPSAEGSARNPSESIVRKANWNRSCWRKLGGGVARCAMARNWSRSSRTTVSLRR